MLLNILFWIVLICDAGVLFLWFLLGLAAAKPSHTSPIAVFGFMLIPAALLFGCALVFLRSKTVLFRSGAFLLLALPVVVPLLAAGVERLTMQVLTDPAGNTIHYRSGPLRTVEAAIYRNDAAAIAATRGADLNQRGLTNVTLLILALRHMEESPSQTAVLEALLRGGADPNQTGNYQLPLTIALRISERAGPEPVRVLLEAGAKPNARDGYGTPAFFLATGAKVPLDLLKLMIEKGADVTLADNGGGTAVNYAAQVRNWPAVLLLLERGANPSKIFVPTGMTLIESLELSARANPTEPGLAELIRHLKASK